VDQPPEAEIADHGPPELDDLLFAVELQQLIEERLVDVVVVDEEALGVMQGRLLGVAEVGVGPVADLRDGFLFEGLSFP